MPILPWSDDVEYIYKKRVPRESKFCMIWLPVDANCWILHDRVGCWACFLSMSNPQFQVELTYCFSIDVRVTQRSFKALCAETIPSDAVCSNCHKPIHCPLWITPCENNNNNRWSELIFDAGSSHLILKRPFADLVTECTVFSLVSALNYSTGRESENVKKVAATN